MARDRIGEDNRGGGIGQRRGVARNRSGRRRVAVGDDSVHDRVSRLGDVLVPMTERAQRSTREAREARLTASTEARSGNPSSASVDPVEAVLMVAVAVAACSIVGGRKCCPRWRERAVEYAKTFSDGGRVHVNTDSSTSCTRRGCSTRAIIRSVPSRVHPASGAESA